MTYNEIVTDIQTKLESHPMIKTVLFNSPQEWLNRDTQPQYPVACFTINSGNFSSGRSMTYTINFWFLDKSGVEAEFETEVINEQHGIANDFISWMRRQDSAYLIDASVNWTAVSEKFEDYISGVELTVNAELISDYGACDYPV